MRIDKYMQIEPQQYVCKKLKVANSDIIIIVMNFMILDVANVNTLISKTDVK